MKKFDKFDRLDTIIVGAGISGLLSALVLSKHGKKVLIIEKEAYLGGNCRSYAVDGFQVDTGVHAITNLRVGPLRRLMDNYFDYIPYFVEHGSYFVRTENKFLKAPSNLQDFLNFSILSKKDRLAMSAVVTKALTLFSLRVKDLSKESVYDFLPKGLSKDCYSFADTFSYFLSGKSMKKTSAHRILTGSNFVRDSITQKDFEKIIAKIEEAEKDKKPSDFQEIVENQLQKVDKLLKIPLKPIKRIVSNNSGEDQGYPRKGLKGLLDCLLMSLPESVKIIKGREVKKIITKDGAVVGVEADKIYYANVVIYTGFAKNLPLLVDDLPGSYVLNLKKIDIAKSLTIWIGLDKKIADFNYLGSEIWFKGEHPYWAMPISNYDSSLAPKDKQLIGFTFIINEDISDEVKIKKSYETIFKNHPEIKKNLIMKHEQIIIPEKASVTIDGNFANIRTPIKNLYIAGTDTDKRSMGITRASHSVIELLNILNQDGNLH